MCRDWSLEELKTLHLNQHFLGGHTVDGRNPAPPGGDV